MSENENGSVLAAAQEDVKVAVKMLSVSEILAANDIKEEVVDVPEWGGKVLVRGLTKAKQQELRYMSTDPKSSKVDSEKLELQLFVHGVVDPKFAPVQATELKDKSAGAIDRVLRRIMALSGMTEESVREAEKSASD